MMPSALIALCQVATAGLGAGSPLPKPPQSPAVSRARARGRGDSVGNDDLAAVGAPMQLNTCGTRHAFLLWEPLPILTAESPFFVALFLRFCPWTHVPRQLELRMNERLEALAQQNADLRRTLDQVLLVVSGKA